MPDIRMPDGEVVRFPDTMTDVQIRGLIASKFPRAVGEANAARPMEERDTAGHYALDGSNIPGYDPTTGNVADPFDASKSYRSGVREGFEGIPGMFGDVGQMQGDIAGWAAGKLGAGPEMQETVSGVASKLTPFPFAPTTQEIQENITIPAVGPHHVPQTEEGEVARTIGNFGAGALAPGGAGRKAAMVAVPALTSEGAGRLTEGTPYEPYARFAGGLVGGALTAPKIGPGPTRAAAKDLGVRTKAMSALVKDMQAAGRTPDEINAALARLGPEGAPIDLPEFQQRGQRIYAKGGEGRQTIGQFVRPRNEGAGQRIRDTLDTELGPAPIPSQVEAEFKASRKALGPEYEAKFANARAVDTEAIANDIMSARANVRGAQQKAMDDVLDMLRIEGTDQLDPHPRALHAVREAIDGMMEGETNSKVRGTLTDIRKKIDAELAAKVPGIKDVDAKYSSLKRQEKAFNRGISSLDSGRSTPRPADLAADIAEGGPDIQRQLARGQRADIDRIVGTNANDRVALQRAVKGEGDWNRDKLGMAQGQDKVEPVFRRLDSEAVFANTTDKVMRNSNTAERLPEDSGGGFGIREATMAGGPKGAAYGAAIKGIEKVIEKFAGQRRSMNEADVAKLLTTTDRNRIVTALMKANGGKSVSQQQIEAAIRAALIAQQSAGSARQ